MDKLISQQATLDALRTCYDTYSIDYTNGGEYIDYEQAVELIEALPSAQPERKTGRWIDDNCSECGQYVFHGDVRNFCPNCGAKMLKNDEVYANEWLGL